MAGAKDIDLSNAAEILKGVVIPPRPQLLLDIHDVYPNIKKIAELIETDQGVSAGVLKAINSPLYGLTKKVVSIKRAVMLLGVKSVLNIVNGLLLRAALSKKLHSKEFKHYWNSSTDTAIVAASVTRQLGLGAPDRSYLMGLFHNCGVPLLMSKNSDYLRVLSGAYAFDKNSITKYEDAMIGTNHASVGFIVGKYWQLPKEICRVIRDHHDIRRLAFKNTHKNEDMYTLLSVLKMAEHIINLSERLGNQSVDYEWELIKNSLFDYVGINEERFEEVFANALDDLSDYGVHGVKVVDEE